MNFQDGDRLRTYHNINGMWGDSLWHEGEWAIYRPVAFANSTSMMRASPNGYNCVLVHSRIWMEKKVVHKEEKTRWRMCGDDDEVSQGYFETEEVEMVCHTQLYPKSSTECTTCRATIPEGAIALWKLMNTEHLSEEA